jgi:hypothetical protein
LLCGRKGAYKKIWPASVIIYKWKRPVFLGTRPALSTNYNGHQISSGDPCRLSTTTQPSRSPTRGPPAGLLPLLTSYLTKSLRTSLEEAKDPMLCSQSTYKIETQSGFRYMPSRKVRRRRGLFINRFISLFGGRRSIQFGKGRPHRCHHCYQDPTSPFHHAGHWPAV